MKKLIIDGNEAVAKASYKLSENAFVYPITPSTAMAENFEKWSANGEQNIFGQKVEVTEMQSEAGVAGALHGSALSGSLTTTFTSSQGLLLMIPNMYKIAGEMLPTVINVASRSVASHALNIFCDHSDVMSVRETGFCMLASSNPQEAYDFAIASHLTSLKTKLPFLHFFDGFRTSHQISAVNVFDDEELKAICPHKDLKEFKQNALSPNNPYQYGTSENADIFFQGRESTNAFYKNLPQELEKTFQEIAKLGGDTHHIMEYYGSKNAKYVVVLMASAFDTIKNYIDFCDDDEIGAVKINLYRPFDKEFFVNLLPKSTQKIAVLDRTKEQGSAGEPLYLDICASLVEFDKNIKVIGGRYGLGGKEFAPKHAKAVFDNLKNENSKNHFTVGIFDDITNTSLSVTDFQIDDNCFDALLCGLGSDGTVSASKNIAKIVGNNSDQNVQAYFMYDSKKSGGLTRSYISISKQKVQKPYVQTQNDIILINNLCFLNKYNFAKQLKQNGIFVINSPFESTQELDQFLSNDNKIALLQKNAKIYSIDANKIAKQFDLDGKISMIMQTAFFEISNVIDNQIAKQKTIESLEKLFEKNGKNVIKNNKNAINFVKKSIKLINIDQNWLNLANDKKLSNSNKFIDEYVSPILSLEGDNLPVSKVNLCGKNQVGTTSFEKRNLANVLPKWNPEKCIECGKCSFVCPHAVIRSKLIKKELLADAPKEILTKDCKFASDCLFSMQISPQDCTGCTLCSRACPTKAIEMVEKNQVFEQEMQSFEYLNKLENIVPSLPNSVIKTQFLKPYFEYCGACAGCGETPYIRLLTQLFGKDLIIANATGCSSIYGGSAPTCPYTKDKNGQGVAWANSLFEDNAEFGFGILKSKNQQREQYRQKISENISKFDENLQKVLQKWLNNFENYEICNQIYFDLLSKQKQFESINNKWVFEEIDNITKKSVWLVGGDGWAYDIDFGGIDHIMSTGENVKILILDTEVYSNTGGQASKSTPKNAVTSLSTNGKKTAKKRLAFDAIAHKNVYVAQVCLGADNQQTLNAFVEAQNFDGPSVIIAYAPCINHGIDMQNNIQNQQMAVESGYWSLFRYNPDNKKIGKNPMQIDSRISTKSIDYMLSQRRFANFADKNSASLLQNTQQDNFEFYLELEKIKKLFE